MKYQLIIFPDAVSEYENAFNWYSLQSPGLEEKFFAAVDSKMQQILLGPEYFSVKNSSCREALVKGFPYLVIYRFRKNLKRIEVVAIHHTSRKPKKRYV